MSSQTLMTLTAEFDSLRTRIQATTDSDERLEILLQIREVAEQLNDEIQQVLYELTGVRSH
jgi:hypothetical protein